MLSSSTSLVHKLASNNITPSTCTSNHSLGPIFDAHDVRYLMIPGSVGIVVAVMLLSVCEGIMPLVYLD
jgi:hypothetical protein